MCGVCIFVCNHERIHLESSLMVHAFMLVVIIGTGEFRKQQPNPMIFRSIDVCQYYAKRIPRQYGNYSYSTLVDPEDRVTAYCKPVYVDPKVTVLYDH